MSHCDGKTQAVITLKFSSGQQERIVSKQPGVDIQMNGNSNNSNSNQPMKKVYIRGFAYGNASQCTPVPNHEEYRGDLPITVTPTLSSSHGGTCDNGQSVYYGIAQLGGGSGGTQWKKGSVSIREEPIKPNCTIKITDQGGIIYEKNLNEKCPDYSVACDGEDECPPGTCRCPTKGYPGYCCIDCSQIGQSITNLASRL